MSIGKLQKPPLKKKTVKIEPGLQNDHSSVSSVSRNTRKNPLPTTKVIKIITTRSKPHSPISPLSHIKTLSRSKHVEDLTEPDHIIGRAFIKTITYYLHFADHQSIHQAKWVKNGNLNINMKAYFLKNKSFQTRLICHTKMLFDKSKPFIDTEFIEKHLQEKVMPYKPKIAIKLKVQELKSKFIFDFEVLKYKVDDVNEINKLQCDESEKSSIWNERFSKGKNFDGKRTENRQKTTNALIKIEDETAAKYKEAQQINEIRKSYALRTKVNNIKFKNTTPKDIADKHSLSDSNKSNSNYESFETLEQEPISFSINQKTDFSKEEVKEVKYMGQIKEKYGNFVNLYRFTLLYHPDIYSTMTIIKDDEFLREAFLNFAEPLFEKHKK